MLAELELQTGQKKDAFSIFWVLHSAEPGTSSTILSGYPRMVSEKHDRLYCCWKEYYSNLLNCPLTTSSDELASAGSP